MAGARSAGRDNGRRATTHWMYAGELSERYPEVQVDSSVLNIEESDVLTSAGMAAGLEMCLHLSAAIWGPTAGLVRHRGLEPPTR